MPCTTRSEPFFMRATKSVVTSRWAMQPIGTHMKYGALSGSSLSTPKREPWGSCIASGSMTRRNLVGSPWISISVTPARNWPVSSRVSLLVAQTSFGPPCVCSLPQNLVHGDWTVGICWSGVPAWPCCCAGGCCAGCWAGCLGAALGAGFGAAFGAGAGAGAGAGGCCASAAGTVARDRVAATAVNANTRRTGRTGANKVESIILKDPLLRPRATARPARVAGLIASCLFAKYGITVTPGPRLIAEIGRLIKPLRQTFGALVTGSGHGVMVGLPLDTNRTEDP